MTDRTLFIIITGINTIMWCIAISRMSAMYKNYNELLKKNTEMQKKQTEYIHSAHESMNEMTRMNVEAMGTFINQLTDVFLKQGTQDYAQEDRQ